MTLPLVKRNKRPLHRQELVVVALGLVLSGALFLVPAINAAIIGLFWFLLKVSIPDLSADLVPRHLPAFPLRPAHEHRMEDRHPGGHGGRADQRGAGDDARHLTRREPRVRAAYPRYVAGYGLDRAAAHRHRPGGDALHHRRRALDRRADPGVCRPPDEALLRAGLLPLEAARQARWRDDRLLRSGLHARRAGPRLGWWLARPYWGRGLATEAARAALEDAFERAGLYRIVSIAMPANRVSIRIMQKLGLTFECEFESEGVRLVRYAIERRVA